MTGGDRAEEVTSEDALDGFFSALLDDDPEQLYERAPCGYLSTTPDGTIVKVNQTFLEWTGYDRPGLVGRRTFSELLTPGGRIYHETHYAPMLRMQGAATEIALDIVKADGTRLPALVNSVLEVDGNGDAVVVRTAVFDATERRRYERELVAARQRAEASEREARVLSQTLQQTLIPPAPPSIPGLGVTAAYRPAGDGLEIGGDFYDVFQVGAGDWVVAVGDVRGKGVDAAVVTALARYTIRAAAVQHEQPSVVLAVLNDVLLHDDTDRYCTAVVVRLRQGLDDRWTATFACGGHPFPVAWRADGEPAACGRAGTLLGLLADTESHDTTLPLAPGDGLLLYTDGVTEARRGDDFFGDHRLAEVVARRRREPGRDLAAEVLDEVLAFQEGQPADDVVVVAVRVP